jgi:hypothetical protein
VTPELHGKDSNRNGSLTSAEREFSVTSVDVVSAGGVGSRPAGDVTIRALGSGLSTGASALTPKWHKRQR